MSYTTAQLRDLESLQVDFDSAIKVGDKKLAFKILSHMTERGLTVQAHEMFSDILMRMHTNHVPLLGGNNNPEYTQEDMNGGITGINSGNND